MTVTLRPLTRDDIPALAGLLAAAEEVDRTGEHFSEADLEEEFDNPDVEIGKDVVGAFHARPDGPDELVGWFSCYARVPDSGGIKVHLDGTVRPDVRGRGVGSTLVPAMVARADELHRERRPEAPAHLAASGLSSNGPQSDVFMAAGLRPHRWNFLMRAFLDRLDVPEEPATLPDGLEVVTYSAEHDRAMREAHNEAFQDHPDFTPWSEVTWKQWVSESRNFRPELSLVVLDPARLGTVAAYVQSNEFDAYFEATGRREAFVAKVGTRRAYRGRGLASALLRESLRRYRAAGYDEAALDVDSENPTGALGIYRRAGFEVESRWTNYVLERPALT